MKTLLIALAATAMLTLGCTPSDQADPDAEVTPEAAEAPEQITEMDFESGEVEQSSDGSEDSATEPTPEAE